MKQLKNIFIIVSILVLVSSSLLKNKVSAQITSGRVIKLERFSLYNEYFNMDTLWSFHMSNEDLKEIKLFYRKENEKSDKNEDIKIQYKNNNLPFVYLGEEAFKTKGIEKTKFSISSNTYKITKIEVISKIDREYDFTLYVLDGYGLLIQNSNLWNNHLRFLPEDINVAIPLNILCDLIVLKQEFNELKMNHN